MRRSGRLKIEGTLQGRVLVALIEGPSSGVDLMKKLSLRSSGTIYPVLKTLKSKNFIKYTTEQVSGKKLYVLTEKGKEQLETILLGISRGYFARFVEPYVSSFTSALTSLIRVKSGQRVLCTLEHEPMKKLFIKADATYLPVLEPPIGTFDLILCHIVGTMMAYGWKKDEFASYLSRLVENLRSEGTLVMTEIEKTDNIFVEIFFREALGYGQAPGLSREKLRDILENYKLNIMNLHSWRGLLIGIAKKMI